MGGDLLRIYMQDHYAGATAGLELAKRAAGSNRGTELGALLERLATEIGEDRDSLRRIMEEHGVGPDRLKAVGAWTFEKAGRLKPNGRLLSYSPLSRQIELEGMTLGITGKLCLWHSLRLALGDTYAGEDLVALAKRAEAQRTALEPFRLAAAREAFASQEAPA
jgi:hypothetical protein